MRKLTFFLIPLVLANLFCVVGAPRPAPTATPDPSIIVNATLTALAGSQPKPTQAAGASPDVHDTITPMGTVVGENLRFPADKIPGLHIVFYNTDYMPVSFTDTAPGQTSYSLELPAGQYHVVAYSLAGDGFKAGVAGGYTEAVTCGLKVSCNDHHLLLITLKPGEKLTGINPNDYYAPDQSFPPMPQ